jgi:hypothetical protein
MITTEKLLNYWVNFEFIVLKSFIANTLKMEGGNKLTNITETEEWLTKQGMQFTVSIFLLPM